MNDPQSEKCVRTFLDSYYSGDVARMKQCCAETFVSLAHAPVELFPHLGFHKGKDWIAESIHIQKERYCERRYAIEFLIANETQVATIVQSALTKRSDQRVVTLVAGEFFTLCDGLITEHRSMFDSFDLIQQLIGRDLTDEFTARMKHAIRGNG